MFCLAWTLEKESSPPPKSADFTSCMHPTSHSDNHEDDSTDRAKISLEAQESSAGMASIQPGPEDNDKDQSTQLATLSSSEPRSLPLPPLPADPKLALDPAEELSQQLVLSLLRQPQSKSVEIRTSEEETREHAWKQGTAPSAVYPYQCWKRWRCCICECETHWENRCCSNLECLHTRCAKRCRRLNPR